MSRTGALTDEMWAQIEPLLPPLKGRMGRPRAPYRPLIEGAIYRLRTGVVLLSAALDDDDGDAIGDDVEACDDVVADDQASSRCRLFVTLSRGGGHGCASRAVIQSLRGGREADRGRAWR